MHLHDQLTAARQTAVRKLTDALNVPRSGAAKRSALETLVARYPFGTPADHIREVADVACPYSLVSHIRRCAGLPGFAASVRAEQLSLHGLLLRAGEFILSPGDYAVAKAALQSVHTAEEHEEFVAASAQTVLVLLAKQRHVADMARDIAATPGDAYMAGADLPLSAQNAVGRFVNMCCKLAAIEQAGDTPSVEYALHQRIVAAGRNMLTSVHSAAIAHRADDPFYQGESRQRARQDTEFKAAMAEHMRRAEMQVRGIDLQGLLRVYAEEGKARGLTATDIWHERANAIYEATKPRGVHAF